MRKKKLIDYNFPEDLNKMTDDDLSLLCYEIRAFLLEKVSKTGGHLAPNLGVVELTVALHRVFDIPKDKIIWDVGHQSYVHKILTGRASQFDTLRQHGGLAGFPKRSESAADVYDSGHSSTSISAAMGLAEARDQKKEKFNVIAVIGDGAMTGGLAYEGLNNAGNLNTNMIVILNDNEMSISENIGSISRHLSQLRASKRYQDMKKSLKKTISGVPGVGDPLYKGLDHMRDIMRYAVITESIFEYLGFKYYGPVDGNDLHKVIEMLRNVKNIEGPVLVHTVTKKGKGYRNAERDPGKFHGIGPFDTETGMPLGNKETDSPNESFSTRCGTKLSELAAKNRDIIAITAAMRDGTGLTEFAEKYPDRFYDVGIAEGHAVTFAAGLALGGLKPFFCVYSGFFQRAYDEVAMDVAMQGLPVVFMIDRAGCVGADGETHHGIFDLSYLTHIPGMTVLAPSDLDELSAMMDYAAAHSEGPVSIRYPKGIPTPINTQVPDAVNGEKNKIYIRTGKSIKRKKGKQVELWAVGSMVSETLKAAEILALRGIEAAVVDARFVKPLDEKALMQVAKKKIPVITIEDNVIRGGFGEAIAAWFSENGFSVPLRRIGWPDAFVPHGSVKELMKDYGLDAESIADKALEALGLAKAPADKSLNDEAPDIDTPIEALGVSPAVSEDEAAPVIPVTDGLLH
ncbi:MAG: 1-deoxy-D-xylulose-5-phosphate synthase [Clostridiales Family XIII bacterium]|jgi:1-deoxy-D-xylulose-5-phosphate synthase|nr:1-deoxy-D-xylulose-5-phosphate synthase [Clostridiales Family XIII bacterium]